MQESKPTGRPTIYCKELADYICELIAASDIGIVRLCKSDDNLPHFSQIFRWLGDVEDKNKDYFREQYARARELQAERLSHEIIEIADDSKKDTLISEEGAPYPNTEWIQRSRLRVDARKWLASKLAPKKYGDKLDVTSDGQKISNIFKIGYSNTKPDEAEQ